jgi:isoleucyl-tRNA synthetase
LQQRTQQLINEVTAQMRAYRVGVAGHLIIEFSNFLSTFYLRQSRERLKVSAEARAVTYQALYNLSLLIAPLMPFFSEFLYQNLGGERESVHLEKWPSVKEVKEEKDLSEKMKLLAELMQLGNAQRRSLGIKTKQPLAAVYIKGEKKKLELVALDAQVQEVLAGELNVKKVITPMSKYESMTGELHLTIEDKKQEGTDEMSVEFDTKLTKALIAEGQARELMREIAGERKKQGLDARDEWSYKVKKIPRGWREEIERKTKTKLLLAK